MAYVAPNGIIQLFHGTSLTPEYVDTIWFENKTQQNDMFSQIVHKEFTNQMYTRVSENKCRVQAIADSIRDCDYMRFKNTRGLDSKWFYAFITNIEYINENVSEITYEIDELQSWYLDGQFRACYIERQHSETDEVGQNLQPEPLECNDHVVTKTYAEIGSTSIGYIISIGTVNKVKSMALDENWRALFEQNRFGGYASTLKYLYFATPAQIIEFMNKVAFIDGAIQGLFVANDMWVIMGMYAVPTDFFSVNGTQISVAGVSCNVLAEFPKVINVNSQYSGGYVTPPTYHGFGTFEGNIYTPINKKLLTAPYTYLEIETPVSSQDYKFESFLSDNPIAGRGRYDFKITGCCNPEPALIIQPEEYNHDSNVYKYALTVEGFPMIPVYECGMFENAGKSLGAATKTALMAAINAFANDGFQGLKVGLSDFPALATDLIHKIPTIHTVGGVKCGGGSTNIAPIMVRKELPSASDKFFSVMFNQMGLRVEIARKFDRFLSKYGYAQNTVAIPNIHARQKWTYVKTRDCRFSGYCPATAKEKINSIMNNGITWWDFRTTVGSYGDFSNPIIEVG